jgi:hypothetical protein
MKRVSIFTDQEFEAATRRLNVLANATNGSKEAQELKKLNSAIAQYEKRKRLIGLFCTNEMLRAR